MLGGPTIGGILQFYLFLLCIYLFFCQFSFFNQGFFLVLPSLVCHPVVGDAFINRFSILDGKFF